jgi:hypothetical protein
MGKQKTCSIGKRKKGKLEHIQSITIEQESTTGDYKEALVIWFAGCIERDGFNPSSEQAKSGAY